MRNETAARSQTPPLHVIVGEQWNLSLLLVMLDNQLLYLKKKKSLKTVDGLFKNKQTKQQPLRGIVENTFMI